MPSNPALLHGRSNAYNIFILVLTMFSMVIMAAYFLPLNPATIQLLQFYDSLICIFFLVDFFLTFKAAQSKTNFFIKDGGWLDLIGSIPSFRLVLPYKLLGLIRLGRLHRAGASIAILAFNGEASFCGIYYRTAVSMLPS